MMKEERFRKMALFLYHLFYGRLVHHLIASIPDMPSKELFSGQDVSTSKSATEFLREYMSDISTAMK
jgi:hypothetical protein